MSVLLQDAVVDHIRTLFTRHEVAEVRPYAGEFSAEEVDQVSFTCPAILVAHVGWQPVKGPARLAGRHVKTASLAAFIVTKNAQTREARMREAAVLSERLAMALRDWRPASTAALEIADVGEEPSAENLYSRAIDKRGLALWLVRWKQECRALLPPAQMWDLLRIEITDKTVPGTVPAGSSSSGAVVVAEDVQFQPPTGSA